MTRDDLAERLGVTRPYVDHLCRGGRRPSLELAFKIEKLTRGEVAAASWTAVPAHSGD
jgi:transcriptional regulator with XRE-family HTH domain